jgi:hypothetical protein
MLASLYKGLSSGPIYHPHIISNVDYAVHQKNSRSPESYSGSPPTILQRDLSDSS